MHLTVTQSRSAACGSILRCSAWLLQRRVLHMDRGQDRGRRTENRTGRDDLGRDGTPQDRIKQGTGERTEDFSPCSLESKGQSRAVQTPFSVSSVTSFAVTMPINASKACPHSGCVHDNVILYYRYMYVLLYVSVYVCLYEATSMLIWPYIPEL